MDIPTEPSGNIPGPGRNDPCPCGSGKKFKSCCGRLDSPVQADMHPGTAAPAQYSRVELEPLVALMEAGHFAELEARARELLRTRPVLGFAWQLLAVALGRQGKDALQALATAAQCLPDDAVAHFNLGNELARRGQLQEAAISYRRALAVQPQLAPAHQSLGEILLELDRLDEAAVSFRRALQIRPDFADAHQGLGKVLLRLGECDAALPSCRRALELRPDFAQAHNTLGNALLRLARPEEAFASFRRALLLDPNFAAAHANLGNALRTGGRLDDAVAAYRRALLIDPTFVSAHTELATALRLQHHTAAAEASCRKALELNPNSSATLTVLAELRADTGRFAEAEDLFKRAVALDPQSPDAWAGLARVRRMTPADRDWLIGVQRLIARELPPQRELLLRYSIGKYFDDVGDFDNAFGHYRRANELARQCGPAHDRTQLTRTVDLIIHSHGGAWLGRKPAAANPAARPVFITGMLRSGTSLTEQILASHPQVFGAGELTFWSEELAAALAGASASQACGIQTDATGLARLRASYCELLQRLSPDAARVIDKFPANFFSLGLIHAAMPQARIIHMQRNPLDTCLSIYFQHFEAANTYANDLEDLAHYYREYRRLMRHWRAVLAPGAMLEVPYEGLIADLEGWSRTLLEFIELPWDARCLEFQQTARTVVTASKWQVRQKISAASVERWRHYEKFIAPLLSLAAGE